MLRNVLLTYVSAWVLGGRVSASPLKRWSLLASA